MARLLGLSIANPHGLTKYRLIQSIQRRTGAKVLLETGTYRGATAARAARDFETVHTIELDPTLHAAAVETLRRYKNVHVHLGPGEEWLPRLLNDGQITDCLVFLDGHYSGGVTAHGEIAEPAVRELQTLGSARRSLAAVVVDDFRCFGTEPGYPPKSELIAAAETHFPGWTLAVHLDQLILLRPEA